jgi:outer membrane biosynthesis protein TonB
MRQTACNKPVIQGRFLRKYFMKKSIVMFFSVVFAFSFSAVVLADNDNSTDQINVSGEEPAPAAEAVPAPEPALEPAPEPEPTPAPIPDPDPGPVPEPVPEPAPEPAPEPR